jgi:hypothetical protein
MAKLGAGLQDETLDVFLDPLSDLGRVEAEVFEENFLLEEKAFESSGPTEGQMAAKDQAVETRQHAVDFVLMLAKEGMSGCNSRHGVFSEGSGRFG